MRQHQSSGKDGLRKLLALLAVAALLGAMPGCGGGGSGTPGNDDFGNGGGDPPPGDDEEYPDDDPPGLASVSGVVVYAGDSTATGAKTARVFKASASKAMSEEGDLARIDACTSDYLLLWAGLVSNQESPLGTLNITRDATIDGASTSFIAINIDVDSDSTADLNVPVSGLTDLEFIHFINLDTDCDGAADLNIDTDADGIPDSNIDENGDGVGDYDLVDASATTVAGADVTLVRGWTDETFTTTTDANGNFTIENLPADWYHLEISTGDEESAGSSVKAWRRTTVDISDGDNDLGVHPLDTGPYVTVVDAGAEPGERIGARSMQGLVEDVPFTTGATASWDVYIEDPNAREIVLRFPEYSPDGHWTGNFEANEISTTPVSGEPRLRKTTVSITLHENHYVVDIGGYQRKLLPRFIAGRDVIGERPDCTAFKYDECDPAPAIDFDWEDVQFLQFRVDAFNDDGVGSFYGEMDASLGFRMNNPAFADAEPLTPEIDSVNVEIDGASHATDFTSGTVNLGDLSSATSVTLTVTIAASAYATEQSWELPYTLDAYEAGATESVTFLVAELPQVYPSTLYENLLHHSATFGDVPLTDPIGTASVSFKYDIAGGKQPASCDGLSVDGSDGNNEDSLFSVGETITLQVIASDPNGLPVEAWIRRQPGSGEAYDYPFGYDEITGAIYRPVGESVPYTIRAEDNSDSFGFMIFCRNNDGVGLYDADSIDSLNTEYLNVTF